MKTILFLWMLVMLAGSSVHGQEYKKFRVGVGAGYAKAGGAGASGGMLWALEPGYRLTDRVLANLKAELATVVRGAADNIETDLSVSAIGSTSLNGQYYLTSRSLRAFAGIGFGLYRMAIMRDEPLIGGPPSDGSFESRFGFYPRVGFDAGHFTFCLDYNLIPETEATVPSSSRFVTTQFKNSYFGFRLGGYLGGGKK